MDGEVETGSSSAAETRMPRMSVDELDDDERRDDGVGDRRGDGDELGDDLLGVAVDQARSTPSGSRVVAKTPVAMAPNTPPTPWTAKTSSASSTLRRARRSVAL